MFKVYPHKFRRLEDGDKPHYSFGADTGRTNYFKFAEVMLGGQVEQLFKVYLRFPLGDPSEKIPRIAGCICWGFFFGGSLGSQTLNPKLFRGK